MTNIKNFKSSAAKSAVALMLVLSSSQISNINSSESESDILQENDNIAEVVTSAANTQEPDMDRLELVSNTLTPSQITRPPLSIYFKAGTGELSEDSAEQIKEIAEYLVKTKSTFEVRGCSDPEGNEDDNFFLSYRRANAVLEALEEQGVPITRYNDHDGIIGQDRDVYGANEDCPEPLSGDKDKGTYEKQRRADIILNPDYSSPDI